MIPSQGEVFSASLDDRTDIAKFDAADAKLRRQTRLYAALSQCNKAIVHCSSESELFPRICRAAVRFGGMAMAWIGKVDSASRTVLPAASFGESGQNLRDITISADAQSPFGRGPTAIAIREDRPVWCQDFQHDPSTAAWRRCGGDWAASAALPLRCNGRVVGALTLHSGEINAFDRRERDLLQEMAGDVSFALDNFAREADRRQTEQRLRAAEETFRGLVEHAIAGIFIIHDGKLTYLNRRGAEIVGQGAPDDLIGTELLHWIAEDDHATVSAAMRRLLDGDAAGIPFDFHVAHRDGGTIQVGANAVRAVHDGRPAIVGMLQDISEKMRAAEEIGRSVVRLKKALMSTVEVATILGEKRDPYTAGHERRVAEIAVAIGAELGLDADRQEGLRVAGCLHDIGKIGIPTEILSKPGRLSAIEYQLIQGHAQAGYDVLKGVDFPWVVAEVALQHHERMDGGGYPYGLRGEAIVPEARIVAVADVVESMSSHRPYRAGLGIGAALAEVERGCGTAYDRDAAAACLRLFRSRGYQLPT